MFDRLAHELDLHRHYLDAGALPVTGVQLMARLENRLRRVVDAAGPVVTGLVPVGDAAFYSNPTLGLGASLALAHAQRVADTVEQAADDPVGFAEASDSWAQQHLVPWFDAQVTADGTRLARVEAALRGEEPLPLDAGERFRAATYACAERDPHVARVVARVSLLLDSPSRLTTDPLVQQGVGEYLRTAGELSAPAPAMARSRFEQLVG